MLRLRPGGVEHTRIDIFYQLLIVKKSCVKVKHMNGFFPNNPVLVFIVLLWSLFWKGLALWKAARQDQRNWFVIILVISSLGILEIIYLFRFSKKRLTLKEMRGWMRRQP